MNTNTPREAVLGDNQSIDHGADEQNRLMVDYSNLTVTVDDILAECRELPKTIDDEATAGRYATMIKRIRDIRDRVKGFHEVEKEPHLRRGQAVDGFFFGLWDRLARRNRGAKAGAGDVLQDRIDDWTSRKLAEERQRREAAERAARDAEERARQEREKREAAEREAREAAERARKPENIAAHEAVAEQHATAAGAAAIDEQVAAVQAEEAHIETLRPVADMVRTRFDGGAMLTGKEVPYAEIDDRTKLDKEALWPFIKTEVLLQALGSWAKTTDYLTPMPGARIGRRPKGQVR